MGLGQIEKGGYDHFMMKEIFEQPDSVRNAMRGRLNIAEGLARLGGLNMTQEEMRDIRRIIILGCGTSWHAGLIGEYMLEEHARIPVEVEYASEFRYHNPIVDQGTAVLVISQSGETADTLAAMREARRKGAHYLLDAWRRFSRRRTRRRRTRMPGPRSASPLRRRSRARSRCCHC
jgi:glucosamine--fructose-6-phosphate aminotransferase (isomerizing)